MASRTYQHRVTLPAVAVIVLVAAVAFSFLMSRDTALSAVALVLVCLDVIILERVIHTSYTLTDDGMLLVDRGRCPSPDHPCLRYPEDGVTQDTLMQDALYINRIWSTEIRECSDRQ